MSLNLQCWQDQQNVFALGGMEFRPLSAGEEIRQAHLLIEREYVQRRGWETSAVDRWTFRSWFFGIVLNNRQVGGVIRLVDGRRVDRLPIFQDHADAIWEKELPMRKNAVEVTRNVIGDLVADKRAAIFLYVAAILHAQRMGYEHAYALTRLSLAEALWKSGFHFLRPIGERIRHRGKWFIPLSGEVRSLGQVLREI